MSEHESPRKVGLNVRMQRDIKEIMEHRGEAMAQAGRPYTAQIISMIRGYCEGSGIDLDKFIYRVADDLTHLLIVEKKSDAEEAEEQREEIRKAAQKELN